ncbi:uncharacterized protein LOC127846709 isoform X2 [Dreissena polymorpha]|uniref:uncharacterized protein LOC127846709 isoform X2 n=1 Tax=Dreissena polymorpha TaxID=45954 RepID=UPI002264043B|nr:uncharacterized protein LOC127846709 isoform X2 [Dreissena polymorpha]
MSSDTSSGGVFSDTNNSGVKTLVMVFIILGIIAFSLGLAKICQYCRKKNYLPEDDESVISEHTRDIIKSRLAVLHYKKREMRREKRANTIRGVASWLTFARKKKKQDDDDDEGDDEDHRVATQIPIENVQSLAKLENGSVGKDAGKANGNDDDEKDGAISSTARLPIFTHSVSATKLPDATAKKTSETKDIPVQRGRPVSSRSRVMPNVTMTSVDAKSKPKLNVKSVHFEDDGGDKLAVPSNTNSKSAKGVTNIPKTHSTEQTNSQAVSIDVNGGHTNHGFNSDVPTNSAIKGKVDDLTVPVIIETKT